MAYVVRMRKGTQSEARPAPLVFRVGKIIIREIDTYAARMQRKTGYPWTRSSAARHLLELALKAESVAKNQ